MKLDSTWLMESQALEELLEALVTLEPSAAQLQAFFGRREEKPPYARRGDAAVIKVEGPLFAAESLWSWLFGGTTYPQIQKALKAAEADPLVRRVLLDVDSPGGEVTGCQETGALIAGLSKPSKTYARGMCASAAYWLGSQTDEIEASPTALLGSIGVVMTMRDGRRPGRFVFTASQSPQKNAAPSSEEGRGQYQQIVDDLAAVFIAAVSAGRGVGEEEVIERYGAGAVMVAARALKAGLIDSIRDGGAMQIEGSAPATTQAKAGGRPEPQQQTTATPTQQPAISSQQAPNAPAAEAPSVSALQTENAQLRTQLAQAQQAQAELKGQLEKLQKTHADEQAAHKALKKTAEVSKLIREGRITPAEKPAAEMAWDIENASADAPKMFTTGYASRAKNSAVPLEEMGHGGEAPSAGSKGTVEQARELVEQAAAEGRTLTMDAAIEQIEGAA